ncbi:hypothetical protein D3C86_1451920 [compost metagenome]
MQEDRVVRPLGHPQHRVARPDNQQLCRGTWENRLQLWPDKGHQGQDIHTPHALPLRRDNADFGLAQASTTTADSTGEHPAGRAVEQARNIVDTEAVLADTRPGSLDAFPAGRQFKGQAGHQLDAVLLVEVRSRHQLIAAKQRPGRCHAAIEATGFDCMAEPYAVTEAGRSSCRTPQATFAVGLRLPDAIGLEVRIVVELAQVEIQTTHRRPLRQRQAHLGLVALRQQLHPVIQIDFLRRPQGRRRRQQHNSQDQTAGTPHTDSLHLTLRLNLRGKSDSLPSHLRRRPSR